MQIANITINNYQGIRRFNANLTKPVLLVGVVDLPDGRHMGGSTAKLSISEFADYVSKAQAFAVLELGVIFSETR